MCMGGWVMFRCMCPFSPSLSVLLARLKEGEESCTLTHPPTHPPTHLPTHPPTLTGVDWRKLAEQKKATKKRKAMAWLLED